MSDKYTQHIFEFPETEVTITERPITNEYGGDVTFKKTYGKQLGVEEIYIYSSPDFTGDLVIKLADGYIRIKDVEKLHILMENALNDYKERWSDTWDFERDDYHPKNESRINNDPDSSEVLLGKVDSSEQTIIEGKE